MRSPGISFPEHRTGQREVGSACRRAGLGREWPAHDHIGSPPHNQNTRQTPTPSHFNPTRGAELSYHTSFTPLALSFLTQSCFSTDAPLLWGKWKTGQQEGPSVLESEFTGCVSWFSGIWIALVWNSVCHGWLMENKNLQTERGSDEPEVASWCLGHHGPIKNNSLWGPRLWHLNVEKGSEFM